MLLKAVAVGISRIIKPLKIVPKCTGSSNTYTKTDEAVPWTQI